MTLIPQLQSFEESVRKVLKETHSQQEIVDGIKPYLQTLLQTKGLLPESYRQPKPDKYSQYLLYQPEDQSFTIVAFVWGSGHIAPIHDHLTWGLVGVYDGAIEETRYKKVSYESNQADFTLKISNKVIAKRNDITYVYPPDKDLHSVRNPYRDPAITIHVYGADIGKQKRHRYQEETFTIIPILTPHDNETAIYR